MGGGVDYKKLITSFLSSEEASIIDRMKYIVAVSGGVDSVVLLDVLWRTRRHELVVAHFDHGIREGSAGDARFVEALAKRYGLPFEVRREELGERSNEEFARQRRYNFLFDIAKKYGGRVVTAHHKDDVVETIALNISRGTRWRGLAVMSDARIIRPLVGQSKQDIYNYAMRHHLEWCEDETNLTDKYARNRVRSEINRSLSAEIRDELAELWREQRELRQEIETEAQNFENQMTNRYFLINVPLSVVEELLYEYVLKTTGTSLLTLQLEKLILAIKTGRPGTKWHIAPNVQVKLTQRDATIDRVD